MMLEMSSGPEVMSVHRFTSSFKVSDAEHATEEMHSLSGRVECVNGKARDKVRVYHASFLQGGCGHSI